MIYNLCPVPNHHSFPCCCNTFVFMLQKMFSCLAYRVPLEGCLLPWQTDSGTRLANYCRNIGTAAAVAAGLVVDVFAAENFVVDVELVAAVGYCLVVGTLVVESTAPAVVAGLV